MIGEVVFPGLRDVGVSSVRAEINSGGELIGRAGVCGDEERRVEVTRLNFCVQAFLSIAMLPGFDDSLEVFRSDSVRQFGGPAIILWHEDLVGFTKMTSRRCVVVTFERVDAADAS